MSHPRQSLTRAILERLADSGKLMIDAFFPKYYPGTSPIRSLFGLDHVHYPSRSVAKHSISSILHRLQKDGLVSRNGPKKKTVWKITKKGIQLLRKQQPPRWYHQRMHILPPIDNVIRLVTFDIPEHERKKRNWFHYELRACGFDPLHKSVFIGKRPLPEDLIQAIDDLCLSDYVHIVSLDKAGTLLHVMKK